jgi:hypothetical protein
MKYLLINEKLAYVRATIPATPRVKVAAAPSTTVSQISSNVI